MYTYNIYLGYQREIGGYPFLGEIEYPSPLQKGDVIIVGNQLMNEIEKVASEVDRKELKYKQQYRIASIHHLIDFNNRIPDVYLVAEKDYLEKYKD
jgi:hypothetical protein